MEELSPIQADLFARNAGPRGFIYHPEVISAREERALVAAFETLAFKPFEFHGYLGNRRIVSYGSRYDYAKRTLLPSEPVPAFLLPLRDRAAQAVGTTAEEIAHVMVTEYAPGAGIGWHRDKPEFQEIVAFSFLAPCRMRFRREHNGGWERRAVEVAPRSMYLLTGEARHGWQHSIPPMAMLRYSVTLRRLRESA